MALEGIWQPVWEDQVIPNDGFRIDTSEIFLITNINKEALTHYETIDHRLH